MGLSFSRIPSEDIFNSTIPRTDISVVLDKNNDVLQPNSIVPSTRERILANGGFKILGQRVVVEVDISIVDDKEV